VINFAASGDGGTEGKALNAPIQVEVAMQWNGSYTEAIHCYTNNIHNKDGGTHLTGLRTALTKCVNTTGRRTTSSKSSSKACRVKTFAKASRASSA
jgi:DNA gyrase subunit B